MKRLLPLALLLSILGVNCGGEALVPGNSDAGVCWPGADSALTSLDLTPTAISVAPGARVQIQVMATYSDGCTVDATNAVYLTIADPAVARLGRELLGDGTAVRFVEGVAVGRTTLVASTQKGGAGFASAATTIESTDCSVENMPDGTPVVAMVTTPGFIQIEAGTSQRVQVFATWTTGCVFDATDRIHFTIGDERVAAMGTGTDEAGKGIHQVTGIAKGTTTLVASLKAGGEGLAAPTVTISVVEAGSGTIDPVDPDEPINPDEPDEPVVPGTAASIAIYPTNLDLSPVDRMPLQVVLTDKDGATRDVTQQATITTGDAAIAKFVEVKLAVDEATRFIEAVGYGTTTVSASYVLDGETLTATRAMTVARRTSETRAMWVHRWGFGSSESSVRALIQRIAAHGFNTVFMQVMGDGRAYYVSSLLPRAVTWGDPLAIAIDEAHKQGIELHAYINAMVGPSSIPSTTPAHVLAVHPEWKCRNASGELVADEGYTWIAPTDGYIEHYGKLVREILDNYEVDGIHVDRIRTPNTNSCYDGNGELKAAQSAAGLDIGDFMRQRIGKVVEEIYRAVIETRPAVLVSVANWGIYTKLEGCTGSWSSGRNGYYQDAVDWMERGIVDALVPMAYWDISAGKCTDWAALADFFKAHSHGRQIIMGMNGVDSGKVDTTKLINRINYAKSIDLAGTSIYSSAYFSSDYSSNVEGDWDAFLSGPYAAEADPTPIVHR